MCFDRYSLIVLAKGDPLSILLISKFVLRYWQCPLTDDKANIHDDRSFIRKLSCSIYAS